MTRVAIAEELRKIISQEIGCDVLENENLSEFLNSITFIKVMVEAEKAFEIKFADEELDNKKYETFNQLVELIKVKITSQLTV